MSVTAVDLAAVAGWVDLLRTIDAKRAELADVEAKAKEEIQAVMGNAVDGLLNGKPVIRYAHVKGRRGFAQKRLAAEHPDLYAQYVTVGTPGRRFELIKPKDDA